MARDRNNSPDNCDEGHSKAARIDDYISQLPQPRVPNADNERLGSYDTPAFRLGAIDEVNGPGATEVAEYVPTRHELLELARYWAKYAVSIEYAWFANQQGSSSEWRQRRFAWRRVDRIRNLLGAEVDKVLGEVYEHHGNIVGKKNWNAFLRGYGGR